MTASTIISGIEKTVKFNRVNKDYDCFVTIDGGEPQYIGSASTHHDGENLCDTFAYDYLSDTHTDETAAELLMQDAPTMGQRLCAARAIVIADEDADAAVQVIHLDTRTEAERAYDALKDGSAYVRPADPLVALRAQIDAETDPDAKKRLIFRMADQVLGISDETPDTNDELPFGQLRDGTPITGVYDKHEPGGRSGLVHARVNGILLTAQEDPSLFSITNHRLEDMTIEQVNAVRAILSTDIPEQLLAAAIAHRRGDALPPHLPVSAVRTASWYRDPNEQGDLTEEPCGPLAWVDYLCGEGDSEALVSVDVTDGRIGYVRLAGEAIESLDALHRAMPNMAAILADPRVQAAWAS